MPIRWRAVGGRRQVERARRRRLAVLLLLRLPGHRPPARPAAISLSMPMRPLSFHPLASMATMRRTSAEIATVIKAGSVTTRAQVPIGVATNVARQIGKTKGRSARRIASGNSWNTAGNPITLLMAMAAWGPNTRLNTGTEINAAPKPTKPRNKPAIVTAIRTTTSRASIGTPNSSDT